MNEDNKAIEAKINTLCGLLPQSMPFVVSQVSKAIELAKEAENFDRNLDVTIRVAEQINKYTQGELLYDYIPIIVSLLKDVPEDTDLSAFDTIDHKVKITLANVKQFLGIYGEHTKQAVNMLGDYKDDYKLCLVLMAYLYDDIAHGKNVINIAYIITVLNYSHFNFVNGVFNIYCDILGKISEIDY